MRLFPRLPAACLTTVALLACGGPDGAARGPTDPPAAPPQDATRGAGQPGVPCASTSACATGQVCTVEDGACDRPPGCTPDMICAAVCYGTCRPAAAPSRP